MPTRPSNFPIFDFTASSIESYPDLEKSLVKILEHHPDTYFSIIDHEGIERTVSFKKAYAGNRFHFTHDVS